MYHIYHIPDYVWEHYPNYGLGKIGCTNKEPKKRVEEQGYSSFEILETHDCIDRASNREIQLQKQYGYPIDKIPYKTSVERQLKGSLSNSYENKIRAARKGGYVQGNKEEQKQRMREYGYKQRKPVLQYDLENKYLNEFESLAQVLKLLGVRNVSDVCNGKRKTAGGFIWKWKD